MARVVSPWAGRTLAAATAAAVIGLAGCSGGSGSATGHSPAPARTKVTPSQTPTTASASPTGPVPIVPLKKSKFYFMTRLSRAKLCGLLHGHEPSTILGSAAGPATYLDTLGLGVVCTWSKLGGTGELYIGISKIFPWRGAKPIDKFAGDKPTIIDGHPADIGSPNSHIPYATAHVAIAGLNDPVVEFRAPTRAAVLKLAQTVVPRLLSIHGAG
jgi:hypothetical protein